MCNSKTNVPDPRESYDSWRLQLFCDIVHALNCETICHKMDMKKYLMGQTVMETTRVPKDNELYERVNWDYEKYSYVLNHSESFLDLAQYETHSIIISGLFQSSTEKEINKLCRNRKYADSKLCGEKLKRMHSRVESYYFDRIEEQEKIEDEMQKKYLPSDFKYLSRQVCASAFTNTSSNNSDVELLLFFEMIVNEVLTLSKNVYTIYQPKLPYPFKKNVSISKDEKQYDFEAYKYNKDPEIAADQKRKELKWWDVWQSSFMNEIYDDALLDYCMLIIEQIRSDIEVKGTKEIIKEAKATQAAIKTAQNIANLDELDKIAWKFIPIVFAMLKNVSLAEKIISNAENALKSGCDNDISITLSVEEHDEIKEIQIYLAMIYENRDAPKNLRYNGTLSKRGWWSFVRKRYKDKIKLSHDEKEENEQSLQSDENYVSCMTTLGAFINDLEKSSLNDLLRKIYSEIRKYNQETQKSIMLYDYNMQKEMYDNLVEFNDTTPLEYNETEKMQQIASTAINAYGIRYIYELPDYKLSYIECNRENLDELLQKSTKALKEHIEDIMNNNRSNLHTDANKIRLDFVNLVRGYAAEHNNNYILPVMDYYEKQLKEDEVFESTRQTWHQILPISVIHSVVDNQLNGDATALSVFCDYFDRAVIQHCRECKEENEYLQPYRDVLGLMMAPRKKDDYRNVALSSEKDWQEIVRLYQMLKLFSESTKGNIEEFIQKYGNEIMW